MGNGREERGVGLDQHPIKWGNRGGGTNLLGARERDDAAERQKRAELERMLSLGRSSSEAVEDHSRRYTLVAEDREGVIPCLPGMDHQRQVEAMR